MSAGILSIMESISNPNLRDHIERVGQVLYQREPV
jgi:hypothetical protein